MHAQVGLQLLFVPASPISAFSNFLYLHNAMLYYIGIWLSFLTFLANKVHKNVMKGSIKHSRFMILPFVKPFKQKLLGLA